MKMLVLVVSIPGENPGRRKGKGFSAMFISRELVDPKAMRNREMPKGKGVNIRLHLWGTWQHKFTSDACGYFQHDSNRVQAG